MTKREFMERYVLTARRVGSIYPDSTAEAAHEAWEAIGKFAEPDPPAKRPLDPTLGGLLK